MAGGGWITSSSLPPRRGFRRIITLAGVTLRSPLPVVLPALQACFSFSIGVYNFFSVSSVVIVSHRVYVSVKKDPLPIAPRINLVFSLKDYQSFFSLRGPRGEEIIPRTQFSLLSCALSFSVFLFYALAIFMDFTARPNHSFSEAHLSCHFTLTFLSPVRIFTPFRMTFEARKFRLFCVS